MGIAPRFDNLEDVHFLRQSLAGLVETSLVPRLATADPLARQGIDKELLRVRQLRRCEKFRLLFLGFSRLLLLLKLVELLGHVAVEVVVIEDAENQ